MTMTNLYPKNENKIRKEIFHWLPENGKTLPTFTHHITFTTTKENIAIGYCAAVNSDKDAINAALYVRENTDIKGWCNQIFVHHAVNGYMKEVCSIEFKED